MTPSLPPRVARLPRAEGFDGLDIRRADSFGARLLGLAFLPGLPPGAGLLLPNTRVVHTWGMRFYLDLVWLSPTHRMVRVDHDVSPRRTAFCLRAAAVLELPAQSRP